MQNTSAHTLHMPFVALLLIGGVLFALFMGTQCAYAAPAAYTMPQVNIRAQVETDGSAQVVEQRRFNFSAENSSLVWDFSGLPEDATLSINSIRVARTNSDGFVVDDWEVLNAAVFMSAWRSGRTPGQDCYSLDVSQNKIYTFFEASLGGMVVELDYKIDNFAQAYEDAAEVQWRYVASAWPAASENVTMTLVMPLPYETEGEDAVEDVKAWGHGPADGSFEVNEDGSVVYKTPRIEAGGFAEARVLFPSNWLANLSLQSMRLHGGQRISDTAEAEEQLWTDLETQHQVLGRQFDLVCIAGGVCALLLAFLVYALWGRKRKPTKDKQQQAQALEVASALEPAVAHRLLNWNRWDNADLQYANPPISDPTSSEAQRWQEALSAKVAACDLFDQKSWKARNFLLGWAVVALAVSALLWKVTARTTPVVVGIITAVALGVLANYVPRRTQNGENLVEAFTGYQQP